jgi:valyl-tRNA synthetase
MTASPDRSASEMATAYDPSVVEQALYEWWEKEGFFRPSGEGDPFTIIMPPPNLTGELHVGSAMFVTVEDILIRWHRMLGHDTLWQPGVDHAAIAVNAIVEGLIAKEGLSRHDLGREQFLERVWEFVGRSRHYISQQFRRLGASADWDREVFTMDEGPQLAVRTTFKNLYDDGLVYRGEYLINWCPACETALSDLEVEHEDEEGFFWHVRYPVVDDDGEPTDQQIVIATTRPETIPADTAIAVHPEDDRYRDLIGRHVQVPTTGRTVPVIADEAVSIEGGSGALKVTPGHDPVDFEIGQRHDLPILSIIATDGTMNELAGAYSGLDRFVAREKIVEDIEALGLLERIEPHTKRGIEAVTNGDLHFVPQRFERTYMQWLENIRDWCISRQIWWGHRIPAWYCEDCDEITVALDDPTECASCGSAKLRQDEDTLDTWFSSGLWPHSTLGWPEQTPEFDRFYPTQVMETGYDIIFFWVARMVMLSLYNTDKVPFEIVYLHGMVRASDGQKMSKSKGNVTDPIEAIDQFGTDALRYMLVAGSSPGNDQRISDQRLEAARNFANKLWNASRFVLSSVEDGDDLAAPTAEGLTTVEDRWILSRTEHLVANYDDLMGRFELAAAAGQVRDFFWDEYADWYIELAKVRLRAGDRSPTPVLLHVLDRVLRLLHPVMPYVTEEIWQRLTAVRPDAGDAPALIVAAFPVADASFEDAKAERELDAVQDFVRAIRNIRAEKNVDAGHWAEAYIVGDSAAESARATSEAIEVLARVRPLHIVDSPADAPSDGAVTSVLPVGRVVLPMAGLFDPDAERERLGKQIEEAKADVERIGKKLGNEQFVSRAPDNVVQTERDRLATAEGRLVGLEQSLTEIG